MDRPLVHELVPGLFKYRWNDFNAFTVDGENTPAFQQAMREQVLSGSGNVAIHVRSLRMMSSGFVGLLIFLFREIERTGRRRYILLNPNLRLRDLLIVMNLAEEIDVVTAVEDVPRAHLGIDLVEGPETSTGIRPWTVGDYRVLSVSGASPSAIAGPLAEIVESQPGRVALHVGEFEQRDPSFPATVLEIARKRVTRRLEMPLLNPSIELHGDLRKSGLEERFTIVTGVDRLVRPGTPS